MTTIFCFSWRNVQFLSSLLCPFLVPPDTTLISPYTYRHRFSHSVERFVLFSRKCQDRHRRVISRNLFGILSAPLWHDCCTRSFSRSRSPETRRGKGLFVSLPPSIQPSSRVQRTRETKRRWDISEEEEGWGPPYYRRRIAGVPLTQNKISARNILCTPPSTWMMRARKGRISRKKRMGRRRFTLDPLLTATVLPDHGPFPPCQPPHPPSLSHSYTQTPLGNPATRREYRIMTPEGSGKNQRTRKGTREPKETVYTRDKVKKKRKERQ